MNRLVEAFEIPIRRRNLHCRAAAKTILILFCVASWTLTPAQTLPDLMWGRSVVKVKAESRSGRVSMGSGVVVARDRVATNCHVTRSASSISVSTDSSGYPVVAQSALLEQDVCILHTLNLKLPAARLGKVSQVSRGDEIFVFGFPMAVGLGMVRGMIREMHALGDDYILETDAGFMRGSSGGALFSARGDLIALPTFMLIDQSGGRFYAVPVEWVRKALSRNAAPVSELHGLTFWESGRFARRSTNTDPE